MILEKKILLGVGVTNATEEEVLEYILQSLGKKGEKYFITTPNPEILVRANKDKGFKAILNDARLGLCDGMGVFWAGRFVGKGFKQRITGTDLLESLCRRVAEKPITVGFLGGGPRIAEMTAECLAKKYPGLRVILAQREWPESSRGPASHSSQGAPSSLAKAANEDALLGSPSLESPLKSNSQNTKYKIQNTIDILFVAFGFPKQEIWMSENLDKIPVKVAIGVGGAFDYTSGKVPRAPLIIRKIGFEWLYRLVREPWRLKRQVALLKFVYLVFKEKLTS